MPHRPSAAAARLAVAAAAVAALALTGCTLQPSGKSPKNATSTASHHHKSGSESSHHGSPSRPSSHSAGTGSGSVRLLTEPGAGFRPVYRLIKSARHSIDVTMYEFADTTAERDLAAAARRGVRVRVILDRRERSENETASRYLRAHHVHVVWSASRFQYTHQKTIVIGRSTAVIMTANLTRDYYATSRDFLVEDTSRADIDAIIRVFNADYAHRAITPGTGRDLVWSPTNSQRKLLGLINGAKKSLRIYSEEMGDSTVVDALVAAAKRGVDVRICGENEDGEYDSEFSELAKAGVHISYFSSADGFYIHGKVIEADYGTGHGQVFIGSENFSSTSLTENRELGLITASSKVLASIERTFTRDFARGRHWH